MADTAALLERVAALNADPAIDGILVQLPLPKHIDPQKVIGAIAPQKDVDGFSVLSAGELMSGLPGLRPATPYGCLKLIESTGVPVRGKHAVVIGRSNTVGKPMALLLLQANATVTVCHSATPDLAVHTRQADMTRQLICPCTKGTSDPRPTGGGRHATTVRPPRSVTPKRPPPPCGESGL